MVTRKKASKSTKKAAKKSTKTARSRVDTGQVPPYGEVIRGAIARGDVQEMRSVAANARKFLADVQSALAQLESAIKKCG